MHWVMRASVIVLTALTAISIMPGAQAQQLPPGVKVEVLGESPSPLAGIEKVVMKRFTLAPGAKLENFTPANTQLCTARRGQAVVTMGGKEIIRKAGQMWVEAKGVTFSVENKGKDPFVDTFFELVEKK